MPTSGLHSETVPTFASHGILRPGSRLSGYEIESVLGQGSFGITYRARTGQAGGLVAIKEYLPTAIALRADGSAVVPRSTELAEEFIFGRHRFIEEASTLARLGSIPGLVRFHEFLEANGTAYIVMDLVEGQTLESAVRKRGALSQAALDRVLFPLLDGLERVHAEGYLHRDIKPTNILLGLNDAPTLIDFGAARAALAGRSNTLTAIFTPGYAAAEQFTSAKQGPWTDVYGLAATLHFAMVKHTPPNSFERILHDQYKELAQSSHLHHNETFRAAVDWGLRVRSVDRPQSISDWRAAFYGARIVQASTVRLAPQATRRLRLLRTWGAAAGITGVIAGAAFWVIDQRSTRTPEVLTVTQLEQALSERRASEMDEGDKRAQEKEAKAKAEAEAVSRAPAEAELEQARRARQMAEQELARLKAELELRRQADASAEEQAAAEAARQKAEADVAAVQQSVQQAEQKLATETNSRMLADEEFAKAQAERQRGEAEAKQRLDTEAQVATEATAQQLTEARAKADAERKASEQLEAGLGLTQEDRQRVQVGLSSLGFDTRGVDGFLGPRSREMIAAWQKTRKHPATGYLTSQQNQSLLREAAAAVTKHDEQQKKIQESKTNTAPSATLPNAEQPNAPQAATTTAPVDAPGAPFEGTWSGRLDCRTMGTVKLSGNVSQGAGTLSGHDTQVALRIVGTDASISLRLLGVTGGSIDLKGKIYGKLLRVHANIVRNSIGSELCTLVVGPDR